MSVVLRIRRGNTTQWSSSTKVLQVGELGIDTTLNKIKAGNGSSLWADLPWVHATPDDISIMLTSANEYTDEAVAGIGNSLSGTYVLVADVGNQDGVAPLDENSLIPDQYIPSTIARDSELFSGSYDDLTNKPTLFSGSYTDLTSKPDLTVYSPIESPAFTGQVTAEDLEISGSLTFSGIATQINQTDITISDPLIYLADGNTANINDLGFVASFNDGTYQHTGLVRDSSAGKWKLFKGISDEPTNTVNFTQGSFDDLEVADITASSATINNPVVTGKITVNGENTSYLTSAYSGYTGEITLDNTGIYISSADDTGGDAASVSIEAGILTLSGTTGTSAATEMYLDNSGVQIVRSGTNNNSLTRLEIFGAQGTSSPLKVTGNTSTFTGTVAFGSSTVTGLGIENKSDKLVTTNVQSSSYTLATSDLDKMIEMSGGGTLTISDSSSFATGFSCNILQTGSSQVTIAGSGFTVNGTPGLKLRAQWSSATLVKRGLNSWVLMGDLSA